ncbi:MAG TPA: Arm DNA-binding domain-containing protein, partial [Hyphomicrobiaceae bacterium]|nr:Arm DNA-binding domain-containing protein [Hyphomicrobiaceae bacterium]
MALTDIAIRNLKSADSIKKLSDGEGLQLWVTPAGGKIWKLAYRIEGLQKTLTIGPYPEISLADARAKRDEARKLLVSGGDPAQQKRQSKLTQTNNAAQTFSAIAAEVVDKKRREQRSESTLTKLEWLHAFANGGFGKRPISEITAAEILAVLRREQDKGHRETAKRLRAVIGEVFRYAIATGRAASDPTYALRGALLTPKVTHR